MKDLVQCNCSSCFPSTHKLHKLPSEPGCRIRKNSLLQGDDDVGMCSLRIHMFNIGSKAGLSVVENVYWPETCPVVQKTRGEWPLANIGGGTRTPSECHS